MSVCRMCVCLFVPSQKTHFPVDWRPLVEGRIANIGIPPHNFSFSFLFQWLFGFGFFSSLFLLHTSLGELAGGGSVAVAVGVSDIWQVMRNMWHVRCYTWNVTHDYIFFPSHFGTGATIRTRQEIQCLPHARFFFLYFIGWNMLPKFDFPCSNQFSDMENTIINRPGVAGAVLKTSLSFIN